MKRTLEKDIQQVDQLHLPRERYRYVGYSADWDGKDAVKHTTLSFTNLDLGDRLHSALVNLSRSGSSGTLYRVLYNLALPFDQRDTFNGEDGEAALDEKTRQILDAVDPQCVETTQDDEFGVLKNSLYYFIRE